MRKKKKKEEFGPIEFMDKNELIDEIITITKKRRNLDSLLRYFLYKTPKNRLEDLLAELIQKGDDN